MSKIATTNRCYMVWGPYIINFARSYIDEGDGFDVKVVE